MQSKEQIAQQLIASAGGAAASPGEGVEAVEYDWTAPNAFTRAELAHLEQLPLAH